MIFDVSVDVIVDDTGLLIVFSWVLTAINKLDKDLILQL